MTDAEAFDAVASAADELLPALTERLERHGLGEIDVTLGELRIRVRAAAAAGGAASSPPDAAATPSERSVPELAPETDPPAQSLLGVASPAVGFFIYADGLGPGLDVDKGDRLGHVEMLGVQHDVRAPRTGTVRNLVAESGEAVEYGQVVIELEPAEAGR